MRKCHYFGSTIQDGCNIVNDDRAVRKFVALIELADEGKKMRSQAPVSEVTRHEVSPSNSRLPKATSPIGWLTQFQKLSWHDNDSTTNGYRF